MRSIPTAPTARGSWAAVVFAVSLLVAGAGCGGDGKSGKEQTPEEKKATEDMMKEAARKNKAAQK